MLTFTCIEQKVLVVKCIYEVVVDPKYILMEMWKLEYVICRIFDGDGLSTGQNVESSIQL